nr:DUF177 domain-containing protein [Acetobacter oeni]
MRSLRDARQDTPREITVEATSAECARVARRLDIPAVASLTCRYRLSPQPRGAIMAEGALTARLMQTCVMTLDDFEDVIAERFVIRFVPVSEFREDQSGDYEGIDEIPYDGDSVDLGEAAVEQLALDLDPYPRRPGVGYPAGVTADKDLSPDTVSSLPDEPVRRPFAGLAQLKRPKK